MNNFTIEDRYQQEFRMKVLKEEFFNKINVKNLIFLPSMWAITGLKRLPKDINVKNIYVDEYDFEMPEDLPKNIKKKIIIK